MLGLGQVRHVLRQHRRGRCAGWVRRSRPPWPSRPPRWVIGDRPRLQPGYRTDRRPWLRSRTVCDRTLLGRGPALRAARRRVPCGRLLVGTGRGAHPRSARPAVADPAPGAAASSASERSAPLDVLAAGSLRCRGTRRSRCARAVGRVRLTLRREAAWHRPRPARAAQVGLRLTLHSALPRRSLISPGLDTRWEHRPWEPGCRAPAAAGPDARRSLLIRSRDPAAAARTSLRGLRARTLMLRRRRRPGRIGREPADPVSASGAPPGRAAGPA